jgi:hypothetical protein
MPGDITQDRRDLMEAPLAKLPFDIAFAGETKALMGRMQRIRN